MYNIALIGAGQIGSRHLQGIAKSEIDLRVWVVDKSPQSLELARQRFSEALPEDKTNISVEFLAGIEQLPQDIEITIIATNSDIRRAVAEQLISEKTVKYIIFEKVLFNKIDDYRDVARLLEKSSIQAWVNCPRRLFAAYRRAREIFQGKSNVLFRAEGTNWGIGCNGIHYIDAFSYLIDSCDLKEIDASGIDDEILESKRKGFVEFTGRLEGMIGNGNRFELISAKSGPDEFNVVIRDSDMTVEINETTCTITVGNVDPEIFTDPFPYQSQLTNKVIEQIIATGSCDLTPYHDSMKLHLPFIAALQRKLNAAGIKTDRCNIT